MVASFIPSVLDELDDVGLTSPAGGQVLRHNGVNWVNAQLAHGDLSGIGANTHAQIDTHIASTIDPHGTTLTQQNLIITGALDISNTAPTITLTDTTASAKSLKIDVDANIAQIREKNGAVNSLLSFDLANNRIGIFTAPSVNGVMYIQKTLGSADPTTLLRVDAFSANNANVLALDGTARAVNGTAPMARGLNFAVWTTGSGTCTDARCLDLSIGAYGGAITRAHTIFIANPTGTVTDKIGIRMARQTGGSSKNYGFYYGADAIGSEPAGNYAIYADSDNSYFGANIGFGTTTEFGGGSRVLAIQNALTIPTANPSGGGVIYAEAGALKYRGSAGTVTNIAPA